MKTNQKYVVLSLATAVVVAALSIGSLGFAQTVTPVTCSVASSVGVNQPAIVTASGGNGTYTWSGSNLTTTNPSGTQFAVSYPNTGAYTVDVTSGGQTGSCVVNVTTTPSSGTLMCSPGVQTVILGQNASVSATGGDGNYTWSAPDLSITNPGGSGFTANYASAGLHVLTVSDAGVTSSCDINVLANPNGSVTIPVTPVTPTLPDTGGGYGQAR